MAEAVLEQGQRLRLIRALDTLIMLAELEIRREGGESLIFDRCQQGTCPEEAQTWCPLCRGFFCHEHDQLYPLRRHDCLRGKAEA